MPETFTEGMLCPAIAAAAAFLLAAIFIAGSIRVVPEEKRIRIDRLTGSWGRKVPGRSC